VTAFERDILMVAATVALACALPGVFLVLRRMAMISDAISHAIILGIALAFLAVRSVHSPLLILGAALTGVLTVALSEALRNTRLLKQDAAIGLVFPLLFSLGVILLNRYAGNVHLDLDVVLLGELAFAPFNRLVVGGVNVAPLSLAVMGGILLLNVLFIATFYKELKLTTFDPALAAALGFAPGVLHHALMALVSVTAVGAFDAVGAILVVALMIAPPATAYLLTERLPWMIVLSGAVGVLSAVAGFYFALWIDASISGAMALAAGFCFLLAFLFAPDKGLLAALLRSARNRWAFAETMLAIHLFHHEGQPEAVAESLMENLYAHFRWGERFAHRVVVRAERHGLLRLSKGRLMLEEKGRALARRQLGEGKPVPVASRWQIWRDLV
jgi:manganese/zinc/iron transport system permease protein